MSQITEALNKVQKSREPHQNQRNFDFFHHRESKYINYKTVVVISIILCAGAAAIFIIGEIHNLNKSINTQKKEINNLTSFLANTKDLSDSQIQNFNVLLKNEVEERKIQANNLALIDNVYYIKLTKLILDNSRQINYLDKYTDELKGDIEDISDSYNQIDN